MSPLRSVRSVLGRVGAVLGLALLTSAAPAAERPRIHVLASFFPPACVTVSVARDLADVEVLLGANAEPHDFQLSRADLQKIARSDLIVLNGLGLEAWLERAWRQAGVTKPVVELAAGLDQELISRRLETDRDPPASGLHGAAGRRRERARSAINPHVWLDPVLVAHSATNVLRALQRVDPANADGYLANGIDFVRRLRQLDLELRDQLQPVRGVPVVTYHDAFAYFARRYGINVVGVIEPVAEVDPSPRYLARLSRRARSEHVRALFDEPGSRSMLTHRLASDWGVPMASLDPLESGVVAPGAYEQAMRAMARRLRDTLR